MSTKVATRANKTTMAASHKPNLPHIEFADKAAKQRWQEFGERNLSSDAHRIQDYARTLMILMQAHLADSDEKNIPVAKNFALAEASTKGLTEMQVRIAFTMIENCWIHGKEFAKTLNT